MGVAVVIYYSLLANNVSAGSNIKFALNTRIDQKIKTLGYSQLYGNDNEIQFLFFSQVFQKNEATLFIRQQMSLSDVNLIGKFTKLGNGWLFCSDMPSPYCLFADKVPLAELNQILKTLKDKISRLDSIGNLLFDFAEADSSSSCKNTKDETDQFSNIETIGNKIDEQEMTRIILACGSAGYNGLSDKALSDYYDMKEYLEVLWARPNQPMDALFQKLTLAEMDKYWTATVGAFNEIKNLSRQLTPHLKQFYDLTKSIRPELKTKMLCGAMGGKIVDFVKPGGLAKQVAHLIERLKNLKFVLALLQKLSKLVEKFPNSKLLEKYCQKAGQCLL